MLKVRNFQMPFEGRAVHRCLSSGDGNCMCVRDSLLLLVLRAQTYSLTASGCTQIVIKMLLGSQQDFFMQCLLTDKAST